jgi:hypothetical protein
MLADVIRAAQLYAIAQQGAKANALIGDSNRA